MSTILCQFSILFTTNVFPWLCSVADVVCLFVCFFWIRERERGRRRVVVVKKERQVAMLLEGEKRWMDGWMAVSVGQ